ncbi:MAG: PAS domain S-box protein, partial [Deltaproteobacteria bacterium]|nr:PAS domain S-box protein [Deltaproteobacteria bacterium]
SLMDITDRKQAEEKIKHLNLVLSAIRNVNQLVVTEKDRDRLIQGACDNLIETRGYYSAWIVLLDDAGRYVMSAESGLGKDFLPMVEMLKEGEFTTCGKDALSQQGVVIIEDPASACADCAFSDMYPGRNAMIIRLEYGKKIYGLLSVSIPADFILNEEEQGLFKEVAGDIAFALHGIEMEAERKLIGDVLKESEEKFRSLAESTPTAILVHQNDKWVYVNPAVEMITGYTQEEFLSMNFWDIVHPDFKQQVRGIGGAREKGESATKRYECRIIPKDGQEKWADVAGATIMLGESPAGLITVIDITDRKLAEKSLRQSEAKYRGFFEASKDVVYITSAEGKFIDMNNAGLELFGIKRDELDKIDATEDIYADPKDRAAFTKTLDRAGYTTSHEVNLKRMDGTVFPATIAAVTTKDAEGNITGYQGIIRDETERKHAEEKIKRSLREKETLLSEIHHRVKNNMQIIISLLSLQSKDIADERALSLIKNCEDRIRSMSLVHEKLYSSEDLSRIDFSDYVESMAARLFQVHRVDSRVVSFSSHIKNVSFNIETAIPLGLIANELISNALKHAFPEGRKGKIAVELTQDKKTEEYILTVTDNGVGFPEEIDYRNSETFGLQLVDMLTEQLHGTVELDRSKGTSFKITFKEQKYKKRI